MKRWLIPSAVACLVITSACRTDNTNTTESAETVPDTATVTGTMPAADATVTTTMVDSTSLPPAAVGTQAPSPMPPAAATLPGPRIQTATNPAAASPTQMPEPLEAAARISIPDANQKAFDGSVLFVDVRNADAYKEKHIDGAINIPLEQIKTRAGELPRDKYLVTYCT